MAKTMIVTRLTLDDDLDQDGYVLANDCDDTDAMVNPGMTEVTYNGKDDDCNPPTLDDDLDQDGYGWPTTAMTPILLSILG